MKVLLLSLLVVCIKITVAVTEAEAQIVWKTGEVAVPLSNGTEGETIQLRYAATPKFGPSPLIIHIVFGDRDTVLKQQNFFNDVHNHLNGSILVVEHRTTPQSDFLAPHYVFNDIDAILDKIATDDNFGLDLEEEPQIVLSGSGYGGLIALWYYKTRNTDNRFHAAFIGDAPVKLFKDSGIALNAISNHLQQVYSNAKCPIEKIKKAFENVKAKDEAEFKALSDALKLTEIKLTNIPLAKAMTFLNYYIEEAFIGMAANELDHEQGRGRNTYEARLVEKYCTQLASQPAGTDLAALLYPIKTIIDTYYQVAVDGEHCIDDKCDYATSSSTWLKLQCSKMLPYTCSEGGSNDFLNKKCANEEEWMTYSKNWCLYYTNSEKNIDADYVKNIYGFNFDDLKNVVFIYGQDDVFTAAKVSSKNVYVVPNVGRGALMEQPNSCDSKSLKNSRFQVLSLLDCYLGISTKDCSKFPLPLPSSTPSDTTDCKAEYLSFPWEQSIPEDTPKDEKKEDEGKLAMSVGGSIVLLVLTTLAFM